MRPHTRAGGHREVRLWTDVAWPVLAGSVVAVGVLGGLRTFGVLGVFAVYALFSAFTALVLFAMGPEAGVPRAVVVRWGLRSALAVLVTLGLGERFGGYGLLAAAVVAATSPIALRLLSRTMPGRRRAPAPPPGSRVRLDQSMVDRHFEEITARIEKPD